MKYSSRDPNPSATAMKGGSVQSAADPYVLVAKRQMIYCELRHVLYTDSLTQQSRTVVSGEYSGNTRSWCHIRPKSSVYCLLNRRAEEARGGVGADTAKYYVLR